MRVLEHLTHHGHIKDGKLILDNARWFRGMLQQYANAPVVVTLERRKRSKSKEQLGYLFGVVYPLIADSVGMNIEQVHLAMKQKFLSEKILWRNSEMVVAQSISGLSSNEMAEFITNVCVEGADLGCIIPEPDKSWNFNEH